MTRPRLRLRRAALSTLLSSLAISFGACSANKNHEEREGFAAQNPDRFPRPSRDVPLMTPASATCIDTCMPDPGSRAVDCATLEAGIEFMDPPIWTFDTGAAQNLYSYTDGSEDFLAPRGYSPLVETTQDGVHRCLVNDEPVPSDVFRIKGGLFRGWGGGMGTALNNFINSAGEAAIPACSSDPATDACYVNAVEAPDSEWVVEGSGGEVSGGAAMPSKQLDASAWDGISFWARRGPEGQPELRVLAGDKLTDDDLNVFNKHVVENEDYLYCKYVRLCDCPNHKPCTAYMYQPNPGANPEQRSRCFDPDVDPPPPAEVEGDMEAQGVDQFFGLYERCGDFRCQESYPTGSAAPLITTRTCNPYTFQTAETRDACYDPGEDPPPGEGHETCGDFWTSTVILGLDWQFYMVPFSSMRQQGFGKETPRLLTSELSVVRFTWDGGWIDYWLDDVRFYRVRR